MTRIALLRCGKLPSFVTWDVPNLDELFEEDKLLRRGFAARGFAASSVVWNDPAVDWNRFDVALIRSTWDYPDEPAHFTRVLAAIEASTCRLYNPPAAVRWNMDKGYLFDLADWGAPIIPTYRAADADPAALRETFASRGWTQAILKPVIGLGAAHVRRVALDELDAALAGLREEPDGGDYLLQPFLDSVVTEGEWSFIYFNGQLSHVLLKQPAPGDYRVQGIYGGTVRPADPTPHDRQQAAAVLARLPFNLLYARLDFVRAGDDLMVIEVELIEPIFSFNLVPESIDRLVAATQARFESPPSTENKA